MKQLEQNYNRADMFVNSFINGTDWADDVAAIEKMSKITREDIAEWASKYLGAENYAIVYKRQGEDKNVQKVSAPKITPIKSNRDMQSAFLAEIKATEVKPIEPVFVDYEKDMSKFEAEGLDVLYVQNKINEVADLTYVFKTGTESDPALNLAFTYLSYLGTPDKTAEQIAQEMYRMACSFSLSAGSSKTYISLNGLAENLPKAMSLVEELAYNAVPDENILANLKADMSKARSDAKLNQSRCFSALQRYVMYGPEFISKTTLTDAQLQALTSEDLIGKVCELLCHDHEVLYYGPASEQQIKEILKTNHKIASDLKPLECSYPEYIQTPSSKVFLAQYDAKQIYYLQISNQGEKLDLKADPFIDMYNEYFGGGMNAIVFQEMREARGLAYSSSARLYKPSHKDDSYMYYAFIATQNDKMQTAIEAFDEIINNMPESENAFEVAKEAITTRLRTQRTTGYSILSKYMSDRENGVNEPREKYIYSVLPTLTLEDIKATQDKWVENRTYHYGILGDIKDLDTDYLKTLGSIKILTLEDIFGY